jgi:hypothetical protein
MLGVDRDLRIELAFDAPGISTAWLVCANLSKCSTLALTGTVPVLAPVFLDVPPTRLSVGIKLFIVPAEGRLIAPRPLTGLPVAGVVEGTATLSGGDTMVELSAI